MPKVSIIIPAYNQEQFVTQAVDSALAQTYPNVEVIVIDDGSTDGTRDVLANYGKKIKYIHQQNKGLAGARNTGILAAQGDYLLFLDSDDIIPPSKLELQVPLLETQPEFGLVYSAWQCVNEDCTQVLLEYRMNKQGNLLRDLLRRTFFCIPAAAIIRRECLERVGLFDESLRAAEDTDMWIRLAYAGYAFGYIDEILLLYRIHGASLSAKVSHQVQYEFARLDKFFANPDLPSDVKALEAEAYAVLHYDAAGGYYQVGEIEQGQAHLRQAIEICPAISSGEEWLLDWLIHLALHYRTDAPDQFMNILFDNLPPEATTLRSLRQRAYGYYHTASVFSKYAGGQLKEIRQHILPALLGNPTIIRNRGFISISLRSLLG